MKKLQWKTITRRVDDLVPNAANPRTISSKQLEDLKRSLGRFGLVELPAVDLDGRVVAGHQRLAALKLLGRGQEEIEVRVPSRKLTQREYDQYLLTSNRVHGDWDWAKLAGFDIGLLAASGFDDADIAHVFDDLEAEDDGFDVGAELKRIKKPKARAGDLYRLGRHRLLCGDSADPASAARLMGDARADAIYTDPPYNIGLDYDKGVGGKGRYGGHVDDALTDDAYRDFLAAVLRGGLAVAAKDAHVFAYCDQRYVWLLQTLYAELGVANKRVCLWIKNGFSPTPGVAFNKQYEPCVYGTVGRPYLNDRALNLSEILNREVGTGNRAIDDVYDAMDLWLARRVSGRGYDHPTEKPPTLHERPLRRCTRPGGAVLDLFGGSGSTLVACEQLGRAAYLIEREPMFVDLIVRRYEKLTGRKAEKLSAGNEAD